MRATIIISVYKNTSDLKVVLDALEKQSDKNFEIIISEDGQSEGMRTFIKQYKCNFPILHLCQEDSGWRKNKALNSAVRAAKTPYIIFIDGDCVLHHRFVENHLRFACPFRILAGKRVKLGPIWSEKLRHEGLIRFEKRFIFRIFALFADGVKFFEEGIYIHPKGPLRFLANWRKITWLKGCNFSCFKSALENINGFDEDYQKPAIGEDIDLTWRFKRFNYEIYSVRNYAVQYHLYHRENWISQDENIILMKKKQAENRVRCMNGLRKLEPAI